MYTFTMVLVLLSLILVNLFTLKTMAAVSKPSAGEICINEEKTSNDDAIKYKNQMLKPPRTPGMKCLITCIAEKLGHIRNNTLYIDGYLGKARSLIYQPAGLIEELNTILQNCKKIQDPDRCEYGSKLIDCLIDGGNKTKILEVRNVIGLPVVY